MTSARAELYAEVAVGDGVKAVEADPVEAELRGGHLAVYGVGGTSQRAGAERGDVHALHSVPKSAEVPGEHHAVGQQLVRKGYGLRTLQVRIAGHDGVRVLFRLVAERVYELYDELDSVRCSIAQVEPGVQGDLVVPAPGRVQLAPGISQALRQNALYKAVYVLSGRVYLELTGVYLREDAAQPFNDCCTLCVRHYAHLGQHARVGYAAADILPVHS